MTPDDRDLAARLKRGDDEAFRQLLRRYHANLLRLARVYVRSGASAEDVVQDTWLAVMRGIDRFEGRSSFKAWLYGILANRARSRAAQDGRFALFSDLESAAPVADPAWFDAGGHWRTPPADWEAITPERTVSARQTLALVKLALDRLPPLQRAVITLRDVEGLDTATVCNVLGISETNLRVLLHRGRSKLRELVDGIRSSRGEQTVGLVNA